MVTHADRITSCRTLPLARIEVVNGGSHSEQEQKLSAKRERLDHADHRGGVRCNFG